MEEREKVIWELDFKVTPVPSWDEEIEGFSFKKNSEDVKARVEFFLDTYPKSGDTYTFKIPEHEVRQQLRKMIILKAIHNGMYEHINITLKNSNITNQEELKSNGIKFRIPVGKPFVSIWGHYLENDYFSEALNYWSEGFTGKTQGNDNDLIEVAELIIKSEEETDDVRKFIMLYIAFNHLYTNFSEKVYPLPPGERHTKPEIENLINNLLLTDDYIKLYKINKIHINKLTILNIQPRRNGESLSSDLKNAIDSKKEEKEIIHLTCKCIWKIRNEIFHYSIGVSNILLKAEIAKRILMSVLNIAMRNYVTYGR